MTTPTTPLPGTLSPAELLYSDLDQEIAASRKMLQRVPDDRTDWKPHTKSMSLDRLATHLAELPKFAMGILTDDELDFVKNSYKGEKVSSSAERIALFDSRAAAMKQVVQGLTWTDVSRTWTIRAGSQVFIKDTKAKLFRTMGLSHMAHHRAQLSVYLRQLEIAVPGMYGPSADEM